MSPFNAMETYVFTISFTTEKPLRLKGGTVQTEQKAGPAPGTSQSRSKITDGRLVQRMSFVVSNPKRTES